MVLPMGASAQPVALEPQVPALPTPVHDALPSARWIGSGRMRFFGLNVYDASLWVAPGFRAADYAQHALALELSYLRSLKGSAIAERSLTEMRRAGDFSDAQAQQWLAAMQATFPDVKDGDRILGLHRPGQGARFWFNAQERAPIADADFSRLFFGIWLSSATSEPQLRQALLARAAP
jgi:hypothetical protein